MDCCCAATAKEDSTSCRQRGAALSYQDRRGTSSGCGPRAAISTSSRATTIVRSSSVLPLLRFDDDHAIRAPAAVHRRARGVLENFDRRYVVRIDAGQAAARSWCDWHAVDHVQRRAVAVPAGRTANLHAETSISGPPKLPPRPAAAA